MKKPLRILLLEDNEYDFILIERTIRKGGIVYNSIRVEKREDYIKALEEFDPDIILSDHNLPDFNSMEALRILRKDFNSNKPFILVTGSVSDEFAVQCIHDGANDYILKDKLARLPTSITGALDKYETELEKQRAFKSLEEQNNELIKINEELDKFVYRASHDLRAPLKSIIGLVNLANIDLNKSNFSLLQEYIHRIEGSVTKLDNTIAEIINYSKNNRLEINKEPIDFSELLDEVWDKLKYLEGAIEIEKKVNIEQETPLYADKSRLFVILNNLLSNSIKYRKDSLQPFIKIDATVHSDTFSITVEDNGIGISDKYIDKIFDMFYRATESSDGSGLGLYIVKETVDRLKGTIEVESEPNVGTRFKVEFPNYFLS